MWSDEVCDEVTMQCWAKGRCVICRHIRKFPRNTWNTPHFRKCGRDFIAHLLLEPGDFPCPNPARKKKHTAKHKHNEAVTIYMFPVHLKFMLSSDHELFKLQNLHATLLPSLHQGGAHRVIDHQTGQSRSHAILLIEQQRLGLLLFITDHQRDLRYRKKDKERQRGREDGMLNFSYILALLMSLYLLEENHIHEQNAIL